jgi:hypothetical protein
MGPSLAACWWFLAHVLQNEHVYPWAGTLAYLVAALTVAFPIANPMPDDYYRWCMEKPSERCR